MADPVIINGSDVEQLLALEQAQATYQVDLVNQVNSIKVILLFLVILTIIALVRNLRRSRK